jgi:hypothetical protein
MVYKVAVTGRDIVRVMGVEAFIAAVPEMMRLSCTTSILHGDASPYFLGLPTIRPAPSDRWTWGLPIIGDVGRAGGSGTKHCARRFPKRHESE